MQRFKNILYVMEPGEAGKPALDRVVMLASTIRRTSRSSM